MLRLVRCVSHMCALSSMGCQLMPSGASAVSGGPMSSDELPRSLSGCYIHNTKAASVMSVRLQTRCCVLSLMTHIRA